MTLGCGEIRHELPDDASDMLSIGRMDRAHDQWGIRNTWVGASDREHNGWLGHAPVSRAIDVLGALAILIVALPFLVVLAALLQLDSPGKLFFVQQRIGRGGRVFSCLKLRTMCKDADLALQRHLAASSEARLEWTRDHKLRNDPRITRMGCLVRKLSLDEFPQLVNVLRGEMSLVGPRPAVPREVAQYTLTERGRLAATPGLTCIWQINGRGDVPFGRQVEMDLEYIEKQSLWLDLKILILTVPAVLSGRGAY